MYDWLNSENAFNRKITNREVQVLHMLYNGLNSQQMAEELSISELTVYKHRTNMMKKENVTNAGSLVNYAVK